MRVLVVEDHKPLREAIARRLGAKGYGVDEAPDGVTAEQLLSSYRYDAVVLDRMLPDGDALDRLREWRARGELTPILFLTARDQTADRIAGLEASLPRCGAAGWDSPSRAGSPASTAAN